MIRGMRNVRRLALPIALVATTATTAVASPRVVVREGLRYKPHELTLSGDGDLLAQHLRWRSWGGRRAVADGEAVEQQRPSHVNYTYPARVTLSGRTYCAGLQRTVYRKIVAQILGPSPGVFGARTFRLVWTCAGTWKLSASAATATATSTTEATATAGKACSTRGLRPAGVTRSITARGESCATARRLVHAWFQQLKVPHSQCVVPDGQPGPAVCSVGHWRCTSPHTVNGSTYPVTCVSHAGRRRVHFVNRV
jgi:hypothetical protein